MRYPAEVYAQGARAVQEAERWAAILAAESRSPIERPFPDRWEVGDLSIRLARTARPSSTSDLWVGTHWTRHGYPEPEAVLFESETAAREWALGPLPSGAPVEVHDTPWSRDVVFRLADEGECSQVQRAKVVT